MSALDNGIAILDCFSFEEHALSQARIGQITGLPKASLSRAMKTLRESGILAYDESTRLYRPSQRLFQLGQIYRIHLSFLDTVQKLLSRACETCGHTGYITVFDGYHMSVLWVARGSSPLAIASTPAARAWAFATSNGRAMLALMPGDEWLKRVPNPLPFVTPTAPQDMADLAQRIADVRATGRSMSVNNSYEGVSSQAVAVRDTDSREVIGIVISYPTNLATEALKAQIGALLDDLRADLARAVE
ncbi:transcriptional regulator protein (plasmid) [Ketogulonicigenium vulgare Y25]|uniref:Transcriptional regulator protein n=1 Tax=Ketogulonicigenium vulgare (strain WSH-001) TaxID=759362 RepID=F9YBG3_KETVW|nr:IclR family transcriptional regulator [Ketogulonicigenium vulgare]ADO44279.1 transcriptional regulator protein [Ketogulonicigenium vulgare Y25]AEM42715.1 Transcriptional regulator protein [Ketogulonicigenium vulgare WSH-001]ALJ82835.1 transcriptional regulator [Ketogulonicigenium vulgare]